MNIDRKKILEKAYHDCMHEMYAKAQPEADYDNLVEEYRAGKLTKNDLVGERHYLSKEEFEYILNKYKKAYNIETTWVPNLEFLEKLLVEGGLKDVYIPEITDESGFTHPGYRSAEKVPPLKEQILHIMADFDMSDAAKEVGEEIYDVVMNNIKNYKNFYRFDREESDFDISIYLGASPTTSIASVKKWWKDNYNVDIEIEERNPRLFWYRDNDYTDAELAEEFDSENWKEIIDREWEEEKAKAKQEREEKIKKLAL